MIDQGKDRKQSSKNKWTECEYHVQDRKYLQQKPVKMSCASTQFQVFSFCGPHEKHHGVIRSSKDYHLRLEPKLGNGKCAIRRITCACIACTNMLDKPWVIVSDPTRQPRYQPVEDCTYWPVIGSFGNW